MTVKDTTRTVTLAPGGAFETTRRLSSGGDTPHASLIKGILGENGYTSQRYVEHNGGIILRDVLGNRSYSNVRFGTGGWNAWVSPPIPSNIKPLSNLLQKYKDSNFNLAVSVGESRESWHMIADRMFRFGEALKQVKRGNVSGALRALGSTKRSSRRAQRKLDTGDISGSFLELHYGWSPLLSDIYNAAELVNKPRTSKHSIRTSVRTSGPDLVAYRSQHQKDLKTIRNERTVYHIAKLSSTEISWAERLGLFQPLSIAWELTTLSFVADWFLPIGDLIEAVEASYIIPVGAYIKSDVYRYHASIDVSNGQDLYGPDGTPRYKCEGSGSYYVKGTNMTRTVLPKVPDNIFDGTGPRQSLIDLDLSLSQVASASALLHQAFRAFRK